MQWVLCCNSANSYPFCFRDSILILGGICDTNSNLTVGACQYHELGSKVNIKVRYYGLSTKCLNVKCINNVRCAIFVPNVNNVCLVFTCHANGKSMDAKLSSFC